MLCHLVNGDYHSGIAAAPGLLIREFQTSSYVNWKWR